MNDAIIQSLFRKEVMLSQRYENQTFGKFSDPNATNDEKLKAFATALVFLSMSMKKASPAELKETLKNIAEFKSATNTAIDEDDADKNRTQTKNLFDTAKQYWSKKHLPELMDEEIKKMIFIENAINNNDTLQGLKTFKDLSIDEKYFVAQYFENQKGAHHHDDPMVDILTNRTIPDITAVIQEMQKKVSVDESAFFGEINNVFDTIQDEEGIERLAHFNVSGRNSDDNMSLLNLYLMILGKGELTEETDHSKILEFFSSVSKADIEDANKMLKEGWRDTILPAKVDKEAAFKAYETDADTQIIKELEKINENLGKIVIKLDDISISLHQLVANVDRIYAKFDNPVQKSEELQQKNRLYVEAMKSGVDNLSPEESKKVLEAFKTDGIRYLDVLLEKTTSPENKKAINDIKQTIYRANNPSTVVARLEGYAPILVMNQAMNLGRKAVTHAAKEQAAGGTAAMSGTSIAATAGIAAVVVAMYGIYKASVVHKEFTDLYFGE